MASHSGTNHDAGRIDRLVAFAIALSGTDCRIETVFCENPHDSAPLSSPLDLSHFRHQIPDLVSIKFGNRGNAVDVPDKVF